MEAEVQRRFSEVERATEKAAHTAEMAAHTAEMALLTVSAHEKLCAERSANTEKAATATQAAINAHTLRSTTNFQLIFAEVGKLSKLVYIGVGVWVGVPVIAGAIFGVIELIKAFHGQ